MLTEILLAVRHAILNRLGVVTLCPTLTVDIGANLGHNTRCGIANNERPSVSPHTLDLVRRHPQVKSP